MKHTKRLLSVLLALALMLSMAAAFTACDNAPDEGGDTSDGAVAGGNTYVVNVKSAGGMAMKGIAVYVYADDTLKDLKQFKETDENGKATFELEKSKKYAVTLSGAPKGYAVETSYTFKDNVANITLTSAPIAGESLSGANLGLGDVMYDFSVTTPKGETVKLSDMLKEKKVVLLNFWFSTCGPCANEFPYMEQAYRDFQDKAGVIAVDPLEDSNTVATYQQSMGLTFPMAACPAAWSTTFGITGYPTSIIIDRYGVICLIEVGGITSQRPFTSIFEHFTADKYEQKLFNGVSELVTNVKPTFTMDPADKIAEAINGKDAPITYRAEEGEDAEYTWPFIITEKDGKKCVKASNQEIDGSYAILYADVELKAGQAIGFDYLASTENASDILYVIVDDEDVYAISGADEKEQWKTCYPWVATKDGTHEVALCYIKDESDKAGDDTVYIRNMRVMDAKDVDVPTYIPRYAAEEQEDGSYTYAKVVLNKEDGYYHVGDKNGPLLLADLMNTTQFNEENSVYLMAYDGEITQDGHNYYEDILEYFTLSSNSSLNGVCTVTEELGRLLNVVADVAGFEDDENEWLKICKYYQAYGTKNAQLEDPIKGLAPFSAYEAKLGKNISSNNFYYNRVIMPRGFLAEFVPSKSGVYRITSRNESQQGVNGWIFDENKNVLLTYEQDERMYNDSRNVSMVFYMEKGKSYYIDIAFWDVYEEGYIYYDIEYVAPTYDLFRLCSPGYFTYDGDATGDTMYYLIQGGIDVVLGPDGKYYEDLGKDKNGKQKYGSLIYADFSGITSLFSNPIATVPAYNEDGSVQKDDKGNPVMINGMIDLGGFDFTKTEDDLYVITILNKYNGDQKKADEYLKSQWGEDYDAYAELYKLEDVYAGRYHGKGQDLTAEMRTYLDDMLNESGHPESKGCVVVTKRLAEILQMVMEKYTFENVDYAWLKLCYYYDTLGPNG